MRLPGLIRIAVMGLAVVFAAGPAFAAGDCTNAENEAALNQCAGKSLKASDGELNTLYKQIQKRLNDDADKTKLLVAAQRAWVAFRDAECNFSSAGVTGGTLYPLAVPRRPDEGSHQDLQDLSQLHGRRFELFGAGGELSARRIPSPAFLTRSSPIGFLLPLCRSRLASSRPLPGMYAACVDRRGLKLYKVPGFDRRITQTS
ncbi:lysozyme inhibitor LprI family protein [Labrys sp. LIt4]|uniref:lysozyme inhibitor LprI family protein n=1 Tax=Labrys sp. LIt4 TaxID=2821355 RepID=UPI0032AEFE17